MPLHGQEYRTRSSETHVIDIIHQCILTRYTHHNDLAEGTRRQKQVDPRLDLGNLDIETWRYNTSLIQPPVQLDNNLPRTVIVDDIKVTDVACPSEVSLQVEGGALVKR